MMFNRRTILFQSIAALLNAPALADENFAAMWQRRVEQAMAAAPLTEAPHATKADLDQHEDERRRSREHRHHHRHHVRHHHRSHRDG